LKRFGLVRLSLCLSVFFFSIREASALNVTLTADAHVNVRQDATYAVQRAGFADCRRSYIRPDWLRQWRPRPELIADLHDHCDGIRRRHY
jgi:hypothetical protein